MEQDNEMVAPMEGAGLHKWLLVQSRRLLALGWSPGHVVATLCACTEDSNRTSQDVLTEIWNAVEGAVSFLQANPGWQDKGNSGYPDLSKRWIDPYTWVGLGDTKRDRRNIRSISIDEDLRREAIRWGSGRLIEGWGVKKFNFYDLWAGINFVICACIEVNKPEYKRFNSWNPDCSNAFRERQYIVANYMHPDVLVDDPNEDGKHDMNVGRRSYMVIEADKGSIREQLAMLAYIEKRCHVKLAMCVFSGGKSVHGWFCVWGVSEYRITSIHILAKRLGADKTTISPGQYVRMPNGWNYSKVRRQRILWYSRQAVLAQMKLVEAEVICQN